MKPYLKLWITLVFTAITSMLLTSCASINTVTLIHKPISIPTQCNFEKFTPKEILSITENVGKKIYRNQESCRLRQERIDSIIKAHNKAHSESQ